jgi:hypothetical protein
MKIQLNSLLVGASCALLPASAFAEVSFLSGVALPNGGEIISFAGDSLLSTNSLSGGSANHSIQAYSLGSNAVFSATSTIDLNGVFGTAANTVSISSVLNDSRGFGVATVIPTATTATDFGRIAIFNKSNGAILKTLDVGYHPDSVTITPDGSKLLIANEGEFSGTSKTKDGVTTFTPEAVNRPGSVSVVNLAGVNSSNYASTLGALTNAAVSTYDFSAGNLGSGVTLNGLRNNRLDTLTVKTANAADVEPEYITASNTTAYVTLQEANAIATLDLASGKYTKISVLGTITQTIDASDQDGSPKAIARNDTVAGMPMPDTITQFERNGTTFLVTANEGDARGDDGDTARGATLLTNTTATPTVVALANNTGIGRLNLLKDQGDTNADGIIDTPTMLGTRSFSIWNAETGTNVYDSDDMIEKYVADNNPASFNMNNGDQNASDTRSDDKGPEPEALTFGSFDGRDYVFVGNERENGIFQFDVTDLNNVFIAGYFNPITGTTDGASGGVYISPESMLFLAAGAAGNTTGKNLLIVGFEGTGGNGSIGVFEVTATSAIPEPSTYAALVGAGVLGLALFRRRRASR